MYNEPAASRENTMAAKYYTRTTAILNKGAMLDKLLGERRISQNQGDKGEIRQLQDSQLATAATDGRLWQDERATAVQM